MWWWLLSCSHGLSAPLGCGIGRGQGEGRIPVPRWARESCVSPLEPHLCGCAAVCRQVPGDRVGLALEQAGCLPCGFPAPTAAAVVGEEASPDRRKVLCLWREGLTSTSASGCSVLSFTTLTTQGCVPPKGCTTGGCCSTLHLLSFKEKLLASQRGNVEKSVCRGVHVPPLLYQGIEGLGRSHACDLEWAAGSGVLISSRSQLWGQPHTPQAGWRRALAPLGSSSGCCSFCPHPPCSSPGAVLVGTAMQRDDPC